MAVTSPTASPRDPDCGTYRHTYVRRSMERDLADVRRAHRAYVAAKAKADELESLRRSAILSALAAGHSQSEVARLLDLHHSTVQRIARGAGRRKRA
jgi:DNA-binding NarL/FixJ family response regulator